MREGAYSRDTTVYTKSSCSLEYSRTFLVTWSSMQTNYSLAHYAYDNLQYKYHESECMCEGKLIGCVRQHHCPHKNYQILCILIGYA